jgi:hypothetical protein
VHTYVPWYHGGTYTCSTRYVYHNGTRVRTRAGRTSTIGTQSGRPPVEPADAGDHRDRPKGGDAPGAMRDACCILCCQRAPERLFTCWSVLSSYGIASYLCYVTTFQLQLSDYHGSIVSDEHTVKIK